MPNTFLTAQRISSLAVTLLTRQLLLAGTVSRIPGEEFQGDNGDTVTIRVPQPGQARKQLTPGATITYDNITEVPVEVSLTHLYHAVKITDEQLSLDIVNFGQQVTMVQTEAVARGAEDELCDVMNGLPSDMALNPSGSDIDEVFLAARQSLTEANVPAGDRYAAVSASVSTLLVGSDLLTPVDASGNSEALREATVGRYRGFTVVESNGLDSGRVNFYHRTGFALASRAPAIPRGANDSAVSTVGGFSLRQIFQYVPDILSDASVVSNFTGAGVVDADRVFTADTGES